MDSITWTVSDLTHRGIAEAYVRRDECLHITLEDDRVIIAADERDDDDEIIGWTATIYHEDDPDLEDSDNTTGDTDTATFAPWALAVADESHNRIAKMRRRALDNAFLEAIELDEAAHVDPR